jgi:hypothetical protein
VQVRVRVFMVDMGKRTAGSGVEHDAADDWSRDEERARRRAVVVVEGTRVLDRWCRCK